MINPFLEVMLEAQRKKDEEARRARAFATLFGGLSKNNPFGPTLLGEGLQTKRKVFISYHHGDEAEVREFVKKWSNDQKVFIPKGLGFRFTDDIINSTNPDYVMSKIREKYLEDSSVTIVLLGSCTHSRRYVDWEIKSSLRQGENYTPNGLIGILLPSKGNTAHLPPRFQNNWTSGHVNCYARFWMPPSSATELRGWIEDAYSARTSRARLIVNSSEMMKNNVKCNICGFTHLAG